MRSEEVLVLYGSQTGNSEDAAKTIADQVPEKLSNSSVSVTARHMQLDDFIEVERVKWPRLVVIVTSSYGVGQAPLGCYEFRKMCDAILTQTGNSSSSVDGLLQGVTYAMIGLGDSKYLTFFQNPKNIDKALTAAGAKRVGPLGQADASKSGKDEQSEVILRWTADIWSELKNVIHADFTDESADILDGVHKRTAEFCSQVLESWEDDESGQQRSISMVMVAVPALIAIFIMMYMNQN